MILSMQTFKIPFKKLNSMAINKLNHQGSHAKLHIFIFAYSPFFTSKRLIILQNQRRLSEINQERIAKEEEKSYLWIKKVIIWRSVNAKTKTKEENMFELIEFEDVVSWFGGKFPVVIFRFNALNYGLRCRRYPKHINQLLFFLLNYSWVFGAM